MLAIAETSQARCPPDDLQMTVYVDGSYNYLQNSNRFISDTYDRVFDIDENGLSLQQAGFTLAYQPKQGLGALFNPVAGRDALIFAPYGWNPNLGSKDVGIAIPQAFVQYATGALTIMMGNFVELAGVESLTSQSDTNFSRSILYGYAEPFTVMGLRATYVANDKLSLYGGINNGWDNIRDTSRHKTVELGVTYTVNPKIALAAYGYTGQQRAAEHTSSGPEGQRTLIDLIVTYNLTEALTIIANYDYAIQSEALLPKDELSRAVWQGLALYVNYKFNDKWRTSLRSEIFDDAEGCRTGVAQNWYEATLTIGYAPIKDCEIRAETRHDFSNQNAFRDKNGVGVSNNQQSFAMEVVYKFS